METQYYLHNGTGQIGPLTLADIHATKPSGITHVWYAGAADWMPVDNVPEVKEALATLPLETPPTMQPPAPPPPPAETAAPVRQVPTPPGERIHSGLADEIDRLFRSTVTFFVLYASAVVLTVALCIACFVSDEETTGFMVLWLGCLAIVAFYVVYTVSWCKLHYRHWLVVCELTGFKEFTPDLAVGFLFIPLFNLYWVFPSYQRLAELINRIIDGEKFMGRGPRVNTGTVTAMCVLKIVSVIPYLGVLPVLVNIFVWFNVQAQNRRAITWILRSGA